MLKHEDEVWSAAVVERLVEKGATVGVLGCGGSPGLVQVLLARGCTVRVCTPSTLHATGLVEYLGGARKKVGWVVEVPGGVPPVHPVVAVVRGRNVRRALVTAGQVSEDVADRAWSRTKGALASGRQRHHKVHSVEELEAMTNEDLGAYARGRLGMVVSVGGDNRQEVVGQLAARDELRGAADVLCGCVQFRQVDVRQLVRSFGWMGVTVGACEKIGAGAVALAVARELGMEGDDIPAEIKRGSDALGGHDMEWVKGGCAEE